MLRGLSPPSFRMPMCSLTSSSHHLRRHRHSHLIFDSNINHHNHHHPPSFVIPTTYTIATPSTQMRIHVPWGASQPQFVTTGPNRKLPPYTPFPSTNSCTVPPPSIECIGIQPKYSNVPSSPSKREDVPKIVRTAHRARNTRHL